MSIIDKSILRVSKALCACGPYAQRSFGSFTQLVYSFDHWWCKPLTVVAVELIFVIERNKHWSIIFKLMIARLCCLFTNWFTNIQHACPAVSKNRKQDYKRTYIHTYIFPLQSCICILTTRDTQRCYWKSLGTTDANAQRLRLPFNTLLTAAQSAHSWVSVCVCMRTLCQWSHNQLGSQQEIFA